MATTVARRETTEREGAAHYCCSSVVPHTRTHHHALHPFSCCSSHSLSLIRFCCLLFVCFCLIVYASSSSSLAHHVSLHHRLLGAHARVFVRFSFNKCAASRARGANDMRKRSGRRCVLVGRLNRCLLARSSLLSSRLDSCSAACVLGEGKGGIHLSSSRCSPSLAQVKASRGYPSSADVRRHRFSSRQQRHQPYKEEGRHVVAHIGPIIDVVGFTLFPHFWHAHTYIIHARR